MGRYDKLEYEGPTVGPAKMIRDARINWTNKIFAQNSYLVIYPTYPLHAYVADT